MKFLASGFFTVMFFSILTFAQDFKKQLTPPYGGTIFIESEIINENDPSSFSGVTYAGRGNREMFDRRVNNFVVYNAYLFDATFDDGLTAEIQVNPEFVNSDSAKVQAEKYGWYIGQLPTQLRSDMETVWIHKGTEPFGGGNNNILIHTGQSELYLNDGILEETLIHEASHTSLDQYHASSSDWIAAQNSDPDFISTYARDFPEREDVAETFLTYLAVTYRKDRISNENYNTITTTIPNRIAYFNSKSFDLYPMVSTSTSLESTGVKEVFKLHQNYPNPFNPSTNISFTLRKSSFVKVDVFDQLGRKVAGLVNAKKTAGFHSVQFDAKALSTGVYIYRIISENFVETKKMVLIK